MFRRAVVLAIVTIIPQQSVVMVSYVVFNYFYLMLTLRLRPYDGSDMYNALECFGTSTMVVIAQLLVMQSAYPSQEYAFVILIGLVVFSSVLVLLAVAVSLLRAKPGAEEDVSSMALDSPRGARGPELAVDAEGEEADNSVQGMMEEFELQLKGCDTKFYVGLRSTNPLKGYPRVSHGQNIKLKGSGVTGTVVGTDAPKGVLYWKRNGSETCEICAKNADDFEEKYTCLQNCDSLEGTYTQYISPEDLAKKSKKEKYRLPLSPSSIHRLKTENASMVAELAALKKEMQELRSGRRASHPFLITTSDEAEIDLPAQQGQAASVDMAASQRK